jgi:hypothetical protein
MRRGLVYVVLLVQAFLQDNAILLEIRQAKIALRVLALV